METREPNREGWGYSAVAAAAVLWASSGVAGKALFRDGVEPLALVQMRATLGAVVGFLALGLRGAPLRLPRAEWPWVALLGGGALAFVQVTYFYAISRIEVAAAILLQYLAPALIAAVAVGTGAERATRAKLAALVLALGGAYLVVGGGGIHLSRMDGLGVAAGLASAVCFAAYSLLGQRVMARVPPWTALVYALAFAAVTLHLLYPPFHYLRAGYSPGQWGLIAYVALMGTLVPFGLYFVGIERVRATRASIVALLEPVSAAAIAFAVLGEALGAGRLAGGALVLAAVAVLNLEREAGRAPAG
ncbi:EamA family transporter [Deferrisoma sp.]